MTMPKNPAAQALGAIGGSRNTEAQRLARLANVKRAAEITRKRKQLQEVR